MWNSRKRAARRMAGAGLAVTGFAIGAATPAAACLDWGYSGIFSAGWPYATTGVSNYSTFSYRSCGGIYHIPGWGECGGYGACGWAPLPAPVATVPVTEATAAVPAEPVAAIRLRPARRR